MTTRIMVVGAGGREHALAHRLACGDGDAPRGDREVYVVPGNAGIAREFVCLTPSEPGVAGLLDAARRLAADLVVVGPEVPLVEGLSDALTDAGIAVLGPSRACARLEGSKAFMKELAARAGIPTARHATFHESRELAAFLETLPGGAVVKSDGLAAGKGVTVCPDPREALAVARAFLGEGGAAPRFGDASRRIVVEELLPGVEFSVIALCDGLRAVPFASARDHKRLLEGDLGPNTGGMGAICPLGDAEGLTPALWQQIHEGVFAPALRTLREQGTPYRGFLYAGLMVHEGRAQLLEFNVRFGDPEAQAVLFGTRRDLLDPFLTVARGAVLDPGLVSFADACQPSATIVCASGGYPERSTPSVPIAGIEEAERVAGARVFFSGVREADGTLWTAGGRVLCCTARGESVPEALASAYRAVDAIRFEGLQVRRDIGHSLPGVPPRAAARATHP